jgi:hypothetical protein
MPSRVLKKSKNTRPARAAAKPPAGVVGLGLMGTSIVACLLAKGHRVTGITRDLKRRSHARRHLLALLREMQREQLLKGDPKEIIGRFTASENYADLRDCGIVVESILEDLPLKRQVIARVEDAVAPDCLIGSTSKAAKSSIFARCTLHFTTSAKVPPAAASTLPMCSRVRRVSSPTVPAPPSRPADPASRARSRRASRPAGFPLNTIRCLYACLDVSLPDWAYFFPLS